MIVRSSHTQEGVLKVRPNWTQRRDALRARLAAAHKTRQPLIMGILNATPDSFSDGGRFDTLAPGLSQATDMAAQGADIIDVGGESTRPGAAVVSEAEERARIEPLVSAIVACAAVPVSIDTYKSGTARAAVGCGAVMINDIWGMQRDPAMARVVAEAGALAVLMHNREAIAPEIDILDDLRRFFDVSLALADRAGIARGHLTLDPGIGFGKTQAQNLTCIARLDVLRATYDLPVLLGLSRKSFLGRALGRDVGDRLGGTLGANLVGVARGAAVIRVHDVGAHADALNIQHILAAS